MFPRKLLIERIEDYHTHYLGRAADGRLFWGYVTFVNPNSPSAPPSLKSRREYIVLHIFDKNGNYQLSRYTSDESIDEEAQLEMWIAELGEVVYCDIKVRCFQTVIDGITFGLIRYYEYCTIDLEPSSTISFHNPWDGGYYT